MSNALDDFLTLEKQGKTDKEIVASLQENGYSNTEINDAINQTKIKKAVVSQEGMQPSIMQQQQAEEFVPVPTAVKKKASKKEEEEQQSVFTHASEDSYSQQPQQAPQQLPSDLYDYSQQPQPAYPQYNYGQPQQYQQTVSSQGIDVETIEEISEEIVNEKISDIRNKIENMAEFRHSMETRMEDIDERVKRMEINIDRLQAALIGKVGEYSKNIKDLGSEMRAVEGAFSNILNPLVDNIKELNAITERLKTKEKPEKKQVLKD
ncbi:MAG: hypothetical protein V1660_01855 [archaeon]